MPARGGAAPAREIDFSAVGKAGRRTGITLAPQRLDEHGLEEVSNLFSSPKKPSPLKNVVNAREDAAALSTRRSIRRSIPRSASPKKTGITGSARRSAGLDLTATKTTAQYDHEDMENPVSSPSRANQSAKRNPFSLRGSSPLRDITTRTSRIPNTTSLDQIVAAQDQDTPMDSIEDDETRTPRATDYEDTNAYDAPENAVMGDAADTVSDSDQEDYQRPLPPPFDDEEADQTFTLENEKPPGANSRRKRNSDFVVEVTSSPTAKRARRESPYSRSNYPEPSLQDVSTSSPRSRQPKSMPPPPKPRGRPPLKAKDTNSRARSKQPTSQMSARQEKELDQVIERVRSRPDPPKSLYVLRRETPADDGVTMTRSGRVSVKPLAYWRNERCVFGGSPGQGVGLKDGTRFPLNSIKEIIRTEEVEAGSQQKRGRRKQQTRKKRRRAAEAEDEDGDGSDESDSEDGKVDSEVEPWEVESGTLKGPVAVWDRVNEMPLDHQEEVIDLAYSAHALKPVEVKSAAHSQSRSQSEAPAFKYAKLLACPFMGCGLVELGPGAVKKPKNSKKMQMGFYVVRGRVRVTVGPMRGKLGDLEGCTRFGVGRGGFWVVPRGNQYAIENEGAKTAVMFFSQGCESFVEVEDE